jgi:hypothetical protein
MDSAQLRLCLFDALKEGAGTYGSLLFQNVAIHAARRGFMDKQESHREHLAYLDEELVRELFWALIIEGIIVPGSNNSNPELPFFRLTDYGRKVLNSLDPVPHDPDGYLTHLRQVAPNLDSVSLSYVEEGLICFQRGAYTAATVMLGVAVEKLTFDLAKVIHLHLNQTESKNLAAIIEKQRVTSVYQELRKRLDPHISRFPQYLADGLEGHLDGLFAMIRTHRNLAGHPSGQKLDRLTAFGLFSSFPFYCQRTCQLIDYINNNGLP